MGTDIDAGDLYFQHAVREVWSLEDGRVRDATLLAGTGRGNPRGGRATRPVSPTPMKLTCRRLLEASGAARAIARQGQSGSCAGLVAA